MGTSPDLAISCHSDGYRGSPSTSAPGEGGHHGDRSTGPCEWGQWSPQQHPPSREAEGPPGAPLVSAPGQAYKPAPHQLPFFTLLPTSEEHGPLREADAGSSIESGESESLDYLEATLGTPAESQRGQGKAPPCRLLSERQEDAAQESCLAHARPESKANIISSRADQPCTERFRPEARLGPGCSLAVSACPACTRSGLEASSSPRQNTAD